MTGIFKSKEENSGPSSFAKIQQADEDAIAEQANAEPPATLAPRNKSEGVESVTSSDIAPAPPAPDGAVEEAAAVAELEEPPTDQPGLVQRLANFFKPEAEPPA
ncbi:MAG: hypothetical protein QGI13_11085, partial [Rhodospirillales bacterium]|nr:hypothetical protein [Rhodospirillales bacterium]